VFLGRTLYSHSVSLSTQVYIYVFLLPGGSRNTPSHFMLLKLGDKCWPDGPLGLYADT